MWPPERKAKWVKEVKYMVMAATSWEESMQEYRDVKIYCTPAIYVINHVTLTNLKSKIKTPF